MLAHDNQIYGLTKGQASPTSMEGMHTKAQPTGVHSYPFNPVAVAVSMHVGFVARGFAGEVEHLAGLIKQAPGPPRPVPGGYLAAMRVLQQTQHLSVV